MKLRQMIPKRKLRATAVRRAPAASRAIEEEEEEPTMRLSSAFIVVVLLHLVAIGGIWTFESVKVNRAPAAEGEAASTTAAAEPAAPKTAPAPEHKAVAAAPVASRETAAPAPHHAEAATPHKPSAPAPVAALRDSGEIHVVAKGENPVTIAKKLGIDYDDLLKLNKIDNPRKLQPGQKLHIPAKAR